MKKNIAILLAAVMLMSLCACGGSENQPEAAPVVKTQKAAPFDFGDIHYSLELPIWEIVKATDLLGETEYCNFTYDQNGLLVRKELTSSAYEYLYTYDDQGRLISETETGPYGYETDTYTYYDGDDHGYEYLTYTHNTHGLISLAVTSSDGMRDGNAYDHEYVFDEQNRVIQDIVTYRHYPAGKYILEYEYNDRGQIIREAEKHYENGAPDGEYRTEKYYDDAGRLVREEVMDMEDGEGWENTYEYGITGSYTVSTHTHPELLTTDKWEGFAEAENLPVPDSCVDTVELLGREDNGTAVIYTFALPGSQLEGNEEYHKYQAILSEVCGFVCENQNDMVYICEGTELKALMMAGFDTEIGSFLQISFRSANQ